MAIFAGQNEIVSVDQAAPAAALLKPLRTAILAGAREPISARELGAALGLSRQRAGYHVKALARVGLLRRAGRRRRRALTEQRWIASARAYVFAPEALGPLAANPRAIQDRLSASYLLATAARLQGDVARALTEAQAHGKRLPTLTLEADLRFTGAEQRARFAAALRDAVAAVVAEHAAPTNVVGGGPAAGEPYRLVLGVHGVAASVAPTPQVQDLPPEPPANAEEDHP